MTISFSYIICDFRLIECFQFFFTFARCNWFYTLVFVVYSVVVSCMSKGGALWGGEERYSVLFAHVWLVVIRVQLTITC